MSKSVLLACHPIEKRSGARIPRHRRRSNQEINVQSLAVESSASRVPTWLWVAAALGIMWNVYGLYQFAGSFTQSGQAAMTAGMTASQAVVYMSLPVWISVVFGIGVSGGLLGSILLFLRRSASRTALVASFIGYALLFSGDTYYGVFAAIPAQLAILAVVVLIAAALLWVSWLADKRGLLR